MSKLFSILISVLPTIESQAERDEAYLAAAIDVRDLERRMRELDDRGRTDLSPIASGLYVR